MPLQVSTPSDTTIHMTRAFNAPRRLVWDAMFTPAKMRLWMLPPPGWTMTTCECDARVGGALKIEWSSEDVNPVMVLHGVFTDAAPHERAVHTEIMEMPASGPVGNLLETHEFAENQGVTTMRITQLYDSKDARDAALASGMDEGMEACYKNLDDVLCAPR